MSLEFRSVKEGRAVAEWVRALKGKSGVYVIREPGFLGEVLYCGESHTGRLYATLLATFNVGLAKPQAQLSPHQRWKLP